MNEIIEITARKCGGLQMDVRVGNRYFVKETSKTKDGAVVLVVSDGKKKGKTTRVNANRFDWKVMTPEAIKEAEFRKECHESAQHLMTDFSRAEQCKIAIVPLIYNHLAWTYAMKAVGKSVEYRVELLKKITRVVRELQKQYHFELRKDLDTLHIGHIESESDNFLNSRYTDFQIFYYTVEREFKKTFPTYPYSDLRTYAIMSLLMIKTCDEHNKGMDRLIADRLGQAKAAIRMPIMDKLYTCMEAFAGEIGKFDYNALDVRRCVQILKNNINRIEFNFV